MQFADDLNEKVKQRADVVHELRTTIEEAFSNNYQPSSPILNCCPEKPLNLTDDPRYPSPVRRSRFHVLVVRLRHDCDAIAPRLPCDSQLTQGSRA